MVPAARLQARERLVCAVSFSGDARRIVAAHEDSWVALWRREDPQDPSRWILERSLQLPAKMRGVCFSRDRELIAFSSSDHGRVFIWELTSGQVTELPQGESSVFSTIFGPRQGLLACGHFDGTIRLWGIETLASGVRATKQGTLEGHDQAIVGLIFDPDGKTLLSAAFDRTLRIWDLVDTPAGILGFRRAVVRRFAGPVVVMQFSPDQRTLLTSEVAPAPLQGLVKLWRLTTLEEVAARQITAPLR